MGKGRKEAKVARRRENTEKGDDRRDREKCEQIGDSRRRGRSRETEREREIHVAAVAEGWWSFGERRKINFRKVRSRVHWDCPKETRACVAKNKEEEQRVGRRA